MELIFYSPVPSGTEETLKGAIEARIPESGEMQTYRSLDALALRLRQPHDESVVAVLFPSTRNELWQLVSIENLLDSATILLILPDRQEDTIRTGHRLRPRFLTYVDGDVDEMSAVLERMLRTFGSQQGAPYNSGPKQAERRSTWRDIPTQ